MRTRSAGPCSALTLTLRGIAWGINSASAGRETKAKRQRAPPIAAREISAADRFILWLDSGESECGEEQPFQTQFASGWIVPFGESMRAATLPPAPARAGGKAL